jgi:plastocyanin
MRSRLVRASVFGVAFACAACGGSGGYNGGTPSPTPTPASVTVNVVGDLGNRSFNPNPASPGAALTVAWRNADGVVHRIVANDNSFDTGDISPNGTSPTITVPAAGMNYHCSIHPGMVGALNGSGGTTPPCTGQYC